MHARALACACPALPSLAPVQSHALVSVCASQVPYIDNPSSGGFHGQEIKRLKEMQEQKLKASVAPPPATKGSDSSAKLQKQLAGLHTK